MHHSEWFVLFSAHDDTSPVQHFGDKYWTEPWELQLRSKGSSQCYFVNPYQLSCLVFSPLNFTVVVMFLMRCRSLQPLTGVSVHRSQPPPGVRPRTRSPSFLPLPAQGVPRTWPGPGVVSAGPASSCWGSPPC